MKKCYASLLALLCAPWVLTAQVFTTETGYVQFLSDAPIEKFTGKSSSLKGRVDASTDTVDFYIDLNTLKTGVNLRDEHMRENYLETEKFPFAEFLGVFVKKPDFSKKEKQPVQVKGWFTIHGVKREMTIDGTATATPGALEIEAAWIIKLSDHNIPIPSMVIRKLSEIQEVSLKATLKKK
jgi:polyisoprenoid-binding protein YceI